VLSLYLIHHQRLPFHHELLLCCPQTTHEELELFVHRAVNGSSQQQPPATHSILFPERLPPPLQIALDKFARRTTTSNFTMAVFVTSNCSPFFNITSSTPLLVLSLSPAILQDMLEKHLANNKVSVKVFVSAVAGSGKTYTIRNELHENSAAVTLYTSTDPSQLIFELNDTNSATVHFSIPSPASFGLQPTVLIWDDIDRFLFRLFVLGIVDDQFNNIFFTKFDSKFLIEVSNGLASSFMQHGSIQPHSLQLGTTFLHLLPQQKVIPPKILQLSEAIMEDLQVLYGKSYRELLPQTTHPIDISTALHFLSTTSNLLQKSPGFVKKSNADRQNIRQQLLHFVDCYFLPQVGIERKQIHQSTQPIVTFGLHNPSKFRVISASISTNQQSNLPHFDLYQKSNADLQEILRVVFPKFSIESGFVLTSDNILKLCLLKTLVSSEIPVIFMGETGSGKTRLIEYFGKIYNVPVFTLDLHGGIGENDIIAFIQQAQQKIADSAEPSKTAILFFDEINTSPAGELMKELVCDHSMRGVPLAKSFQVLAACNPYVELPATTSRSEASPAAASHVSTSAPTLAGDAHSSNLKYNVRPLHATLEKYVWDFGSISDATEMEYIQFSILMLFGIILFIYLFLLALFFHSPTPHLFIFWFWF
jgi:hypothetical protein